MKATRASVVAKVTSRKSATPPTPARPVINRRAKPPIAPTRRFWIGADDRRSDKRSPHVLCREQLSEDGASRRRNPAPQRAGERPDCDRQDQDEFRRLA